jgi:hypothetical protein
MNRRIIISLSVLTILLVAGFFVTYSSLNNAAVLGTEVQPTSAILWQYQCIDTMKYSRDAAREFVGQTAENKAFIAGEVAKIKSLGANCIAVATPYDEEFFPVLSMWVNAAHEQGLVVWFRGNFSGWEGWFNHPKFKNAAEHHTLMRQFIFHHANIFKAGDILTPAPEAENGLLGNPWESEASKQALRDFVITSQQSCVQAVKDAAASVRCGFFSANGDVAEQIYSLDTIHRTGAVTTIDHYVSSAERMNRDIINLQKAKQAQVFLGEFGAPIPDINGQMNEVEQAFFIRSLMRTFYINKHLITGVNYWVLRGGSTSILNDDGSERPVAEVIRDYYRPGVLRGTVTDTIGRPVVGARVITGDGVQTITTGKRGEFSVTLPAGRMDLIIEKDGYTSTSLNTEVLRGMAITQPVAIEPVNPSAWYKARLKLLRLRR